MMRSLRERVFARDDYRCVAPRLDPGADACRDEWGNALHPLDPRLTLGHVPEEPGFRRVHQDDHCVAQCHHHNVNGWANAHHGLENAYLDRLYGKERRIATRLPVP